MDFRKTDTEAMEFSPYRLIGREWMLITAGDLESYNTMTASWGETGVLWNKNVLTAFVRTNRYTYEFLKRNEYFTASFFGDSQREALSFCGSNSGRDCDKVEKTGLVPVALDGSVTFEQAKRVLVCRKLYVQDMSEDCFFDKTLLKFYEKENEPMHTVFIGEIVGSYEKK